MRKKTLHSWISHLPRPLADSAAFCLSEFTYSQHFILIQPYNMWSFVSGFLQGSSVLPHSLALHIFAQMNSISPKFNVFISWCTLSGSHFGGGVVVNNAAVNTYIQKFVSMPIFRSFGYTSRRIILCLIDYICKILHLAFPHLPICFPQKLGHLCFHQQWLKTFIFPHLCQHMVFPIYYCYYCCCCNCHAEKCKVSDILWICFASPSDQ